MPRLNVLLALTVLLASGHAALADPLAGDANRGRDDIERIGCGSCHVIPGITDAAGEVGPPLDHIGSRQYIAGMLHNTPENMARWLQNPQAIVPGNAMPDMGLSTQQTQDIAAYLETLK